MVLNLVFNRPSSRNCSNRSGSFQSLYFQNAAAWVSTRTLRPRPPTAPIADYHNYGLHCALLSHSAPFPRHCSLSSLNISLPVCRAYSSSAFRNSVHPLRLGVPRLLSVATSIAPTPRSSCVNSTLSFFEADFPLLWERCFYLQRRFMQFPIDQGSSR